MSDLVLIERAHCYPLHVGLWRDEADRWCVTLNDGETPLVQSAWFAQPDARSIFAHLLHSLSDFKKG